VDSNLPPLSGSVNTSGTYRCPPGAKDLDAALLNIVGREAGSAMDKRHRVRPLVEILVMSYTILSERACEPKNAYRVTEIKLYEMKSTEMKLS